MKNLKKVLVLILVIIGSVSFGQSDTTLNQPVGFLDTVSIDTTVYSDVSGILLTSVIVVDTTADSLFLLQDEYTLTVEFDLPNVMSYKKICIEISGDNQANNLVLSKKYNIIALDAQNQIVGDHVTISPDLKLTEGDYSMTITIEYTNKRTGSSTLKTFTI